MRVSIKLLVVYFAVIPLLSLAASADDAEIVKQRKKTFNCDAYYHVAQNKSQIELQVPTVKVTFGRETQVVKPGDETLRLGMKMRMLCEAFVSDPKMTSDQLLRDMAQLDEKQRAVDKAVLVQAQARATMNFSAEAKANVVPAKK